MTLPLGKYIIHEFSSALKHIFNDPLLNKDLILVNATVWWLSAYLGRESVGLYVLRTKKYICVCIYVYVICKECQQ